MLNKKEIADVLRKAAARIRVPGQWTHGVSAKDDCGREVSPRDSCAVCWCASGAIEAETPDYQAFGEVWKELRAITYMRRLHLVSINDTADSADAPAKVMEDAAKEIDAMEAAV